MSWLPRLMKSKHYEGVPCSRCSSTLRLRSTGKCVSCKKTWGENYRNKPGFIKYKPTSEQMRNWRIKKVYGLSPDQYDAMVLSQEGRCNICKEPQSLLCVDHCHDSKVVRGLLCNYCNLMLGQSRDSTQNLQGAIDYLERFNGRQTQSNSQAPLH